MKDYVEESQIDSLTLDELISKIENGEPVFTQEETALAEQLVKIIYQGLYGL